MFGFPIKTTRGWIVASIAWVAIMTGTIRQASCLRQDICGGTDMFMMALIALGMLVPAAIAGSLFGGALD